MAKPARGRLISEALVSIVNEMPDPEYPFTARRARLPKVKKAELGFESADVTIAALTKAGDEQDRGSELLLYGISIGVTANLPGDENAEPAESDTADMVEDLIEQIQNHVSDEANRILALNVADTDIDFQAELELPFVNDPIYNLELMRETGIYQSITIFTYLVEKQRA